MKCPYCGAEESKVIDSRPTEDSERIRRRRECLSCHMRFTTYEVDRKSTRLNSSHYQQSRMPSSD